MIRGRPPKTLSEAAPRQRSGTSVYDILHRVEQATCDARGRRHRSGSSTMDTLVRGRLRVDVCVRVLPVGPEGSYAVGVLHESGRACATGITGYHTEKRVATGQTRPLHHPHTGVTALNVSQCRPGASRVF